MVRWESAIRLFNQEGGFMRNIKLLITFILATFLLTSHIQANSAASDLKQMYQGNVKTMFPLLAPDVVWIRKGDPELVPFAGEYNGFRAVLRHWFKLLRAVKIRSIDVDYVFTDENDRLHVILSMKGKVRKNGNRFDMQFAHLMEFNEQGRIAKNQIFYDTTSWWAAFNGQDDVQDRRVGYQYDHLQKGELGASSQTIALAYEAFALGDVFGVMSLFHPTDFLWILKGDSIGDDLGGPGEGIVHVARWEGLGDPFEQPYPSTGFLGFLTAMNSTFQYVMPEPPDWELPFQVFYVGSNGNLAGAHIQEIQQHLGTQQIAKFEIYHFYVLDEEQKVLLGLSFNDNVSLCRIDPNCAFYSEMQ